MLSLITFLVLEAQGCETDRRQCYRASTTQAPPSTSESDAVLLAKCHILCLERVRDCMGIAAVIQHSYDYGFANMYLDLPANAVGFSMW